MAYFSNGSEGITLDRQCSECVLGMAACPAELVRARIPMPDGEHMAFAPDECGCLMCRQDRQGQL